MKRDPGEGVKDILRNEVGYRCPVLRCERPYLTWHHFDPPWRERNHHDPDGMIALCLQHHKEADGGAFTTEQLGALKKTSAAQDPLPVGAKFNWLRRDVIAVSGGNFYCNFDGPAIFVDGIAVLSMRRSDTGMVLISVFLPSLSGESRIVMVDNEWATEAIHEAKLRVPPSGKRIFADYPNGDRLKLEFRQIGTQAQFDNRYRPKQSLLDALPADEADYSNRIAERSMTFPLTTVEVGIRIGGTVIDLTKSHTGDSSGNISVGNWYGGKDQDVTLRQGSFGELIQRYQLEVPAAPISQETFERGAVSLLKDVWEQVKRHQGLSDEDFHGDLGAREMLISLRSIGRRSDYPTVEFLCNEALIFLDIAEYNPAMAFVRKLAERPINSSLNLSPLMYRPRPS